MVELREFESVDSMNETLIDNWNSRVGKRDTVWHLGDFSFGNREQTTQVFNRLNGSKNLVIGNHDNTKVTTLPWTRVESLVEVKLNKRTFVLCHFPLEVWNNQRTTVHLHGHSHGNLLRQPRRLDVGVDSLVEGAPINVDSLMFLFAEEVDSKDHH